MKNDKTKHKYLIGYIGDNQCVYGNPDIFDVNPSSLSSWANPMTEFQAKRELNKFKKNDSPEYKFTIYKLVPVRLK